MHDYYEILQVHPKADQEVIQATYERLRERYDPQRLDDTATAAEREEVQRRCTEIEQAYAVLGDASRRAAYDAQHQSSAAEVIDYRPLPPAHRQERSRDFNAQPMVPAPPTVQPASTAQHRSRLIMPGMVGAVAAVTFMVIIVSLLLTQADFSVGSGGSVATAPTPQIAATEEEIVNQFEGQIVPARQVAQQLPDNPAAWIELGNLLYDSAQVVRERMPDSDIYQDRLPRWIEASEAYSQALALEPDNAVVRADRAFSLCIYGADTNDQEYIERGLQEAQRAVEDNPHNGRVLLHLGVCLVSTDPPRTQDALEHWQAILALPASERGVVAEAQRLIDIYSQ